MLLVFFRSSIGFRRYLLLPLSGGRTFESLAGALVDPSKEGVLLCQLLPAFVKAQDSGEANPAVAAHLSIRKASYSTIA